MRHRKKINHLGRTDAHRKAMLANMASSLILQKRITTTTAKAKALRIFVEPLITRSKEDSTHSRRMVYKYLRDKYAVTELFRDVAEKVGDRPGGYTRIIKIGSRLGDNADMCIIELVDYNENLLSEKAAVKPKAGRRRRGGRKKSEAPGLISETAEEVETEAEPVVEPGIPEATTEEAPVDETPEEAPVDKAPEEAPVDEAPEEAPVDEAPEEAPVDEAPEEDSIDTEGSGEQKQEDKKEE